MRNFKQYFRLIIFLIGIVTFNHILTYCLMSAGEYSRVVLHEATGQGKSYDLVIFGSSEAQAAWNSDKADEVLGINTFNMGGTAVYWRGGISALFQNFMSYQEPSTVVLMIGRHDVTDDGEEVPSAFIHYAPYMRDRSAALGYYFRTAFSDVFEKTFWWHCDHVSGLNRIKQNIQIKQSDAYRNYETEWIKEGVFEYKGKGFYAYKDMIECDNVPIDILPEETNKTIIEGKNIEPLQKIIDCCKKRGCKVVLLIAPVPDREIAVMNNYPSYSEWIKQFAEENEVVYWDMNYAKDELWSHDTELFNDVAHLNETGADQFTEAVCKLIQMEERGEDTEKLFYSWEEYLASIDDVVAVCYEVYLDENGEEYIKADCITGSNSEVEYSFVIVAEDEDDEKILQEFEDNNIMKIPEEVKSGISFLRVLARIRGDENAENIRFCDYPLIITE